MASSDMASVDPWSWTFRQPSFMDPWFTDAISLETQTLTKALQHSFSNSDDCFPADSLAADPFSPYFSPASEDPPAAVTPAVSNISGGSDDPETAPKRSIPVSSGGKVSKRKPRKSKRSQTTFINADPANFRQMVQQVTGARFDAGQLQFPQILKPEPQRLGNGGGGRFAVAAGASMCLPTLDTSAFLLDQNQQQQQQQGSTSSVGASYAAAPSDSTAGGGGADGVFFDSFTSFPTLESWNAM